eukprot:c28214_g1_i1 orf=295-2055(+)
MVPDARGKLATPLNVSASQRGLLASQKGRSREEEEAEDGEEGKFEVGVQAPGQSLELSVLDGDNVCYDNLATSDGAWNWKFLFSSPIETFHRIKRAKNEASLLTPSPHPHSFFADGITLPVFGEVRWEVVKIFAKAWLKNPKNLALMLWGVAVGVSGAILFLVMVGLLDHQLPKKSQRDAWFEVNNQILNALFVLMCLYLHPQRCMHLYMLCRWQPEDIKMLRNVYCKDGTYKPHEWVHILVVVLLLHVNCFAQYALCGLNWGYKRSRRPAVGVGICLAVAIGAPAIAGIYTILSPLGKDYGLVENEEALQEAETAAKRKLEAKKSLKFRRLFRKPSFFSKDGKLVTQPEWRGGLFDCFSDPTVAGLSTICSFCVFGWNMERLGFGNRYVHIVTFILICTAPYWIFNLAAVNIDASDVRHGISIFGIILCVFGLLYGGFWRIQMRNTFGLPAQKWCFGKPNLTDCTQWLFCSLCSLCQEVRTSEYYKIRESKFYERRPLSAASPAASPPLRWNLPGSSPLGREPSSSPVVSPSSTSLLSPRSLTVVVESPKQHEDMGYNHPLDTVVDVGVMDPPTPPVMIEKAVSV